MAHVWVRGTADARVSGIESYTAYKLCDNQCGLEATGRSRVPDLWQPPGHKTFLDIPRSPLAAEFYAVIRGIVYAQQAGCHKIIVHTASTLVKELLDLPVKINNEAVCAMRDYIIQLDQEIEVTLVLNSLWYIETVLSDY